MGLTRQRAGVSWDKEGLGVSGPQDLMGFRERFWAGIW